ALLGGVHRIGMFAGPFLGAAFTHWLGLPGAYWAALIVMVATGALSLLVLSVADGVVVSARQDRYQVNLYRGGDWVRSLRRDVPVLPADRAMVDREYPDGWTVAFGGGASCKVETDELIEKVGTAPTLPLIRSVALGAGGELWVERYRFVDQPQLLDVFDAAGRYLGSLEGHSMPLGWLSGDRVVLGEEDQETGLVEIVVYQVKRSNSTAGAR
ncbi:MAG TPA: hypothetical protein PLL69_06200, partial [Gemmatimonadales bacterium]|nr:hypothetical protein [Gemmatimonadales bacterium]